MEEENISMTIEEDNNQYNPIEINDNKTYNNYSMSIENEDKDDQDSMKVETRLAEEKRFTKGEKKKKRLVEKEEENSKKEKRVEEIEEKVEEDMKERRNRKYKYK
ncbi:hypothetical protein ENUP19_0154G0005 [Entamoeba nuttalli]|uniref:Uncharacterized protein n=1 Tax=Entamoeba nuttalli TaxID=412467 RepID=A0ABQ0DL87_9EUKA